ncbi:hypothetical protein C8F04DRAFT_42610 [Mycena alexandri]|uniref:Uncharacterized protein n=1 Tax=Mycena alexandri TaxID=1745969 RepID=A0AAD6WZL9_9AGAR|nr:hypothetical protein C8F04DRAFT_42610 [Mycena alexandri]
MARGGRVRPEKDSIVKDSVQLPQELIDTIIDEFDVSLTDIGDPRIFPDRKTLRSCALVSRAFVRPSQKKLFSTVSTRYRSGDRWAQSPDERLRLFSKLLASNPHIGQYVRTLNLGYRCGRSKSLDHILLALPNLNIVNLYPWRDFRSRNWHVAEEFPIHHRDSFLAVFSLSSLRILALRDHRFSNPVALLSMLSNSIGLEELVLHNIEFADLQVADRPKDRPDTPQLVLKSLTLIGMSISDIDTLLNAFTNVDISHLQSLCCDRYHPSLFQAARTIRDLTLIAATHNYTTLYPKQLGSTLPSTLQSLSVNIDRLTLFSPFIHKLGPLEAALTLKRISITVCFRFSGTMLSGWPHTDSLLSEAPSVEEICVNLHNNDHRVGTEAEIRAFLPTIDAKGILKISFVSGDLRVAELR